MVRAPKKIEGAQFVRHFATGMRLVSASRARRVVQAPLFLLIVILVPYFFSGAGCTMERRSQRIEEGAATPVADFQDRVMSL